MTSAPGLALAAAMLGVLGTWDAVAAAQAAALPARLRAVASPLLAAGQDGRDVPRAQRRRLVLVTVGATLAAGWLVGGIVFALVAAAAAPLLPATLVAVRRRRHAAAMDVGAAGAARALADALSAGHSVRASIGLAASGVTGDVAREMGVAARALALGEPTEAALEALRRRAASPAWNSLVAAVLLQRDAGGDLAGLLRRLAASLEAAERVRRDARSATAQARFTAWIVCALPALAAALSEVASPGFVVALLSHPLSAVLTAAAVVLQVAAVAAVKRIAR